MREQPETEAPRLRFGATYRVRAPDETLTAVTPHLARAGITRVAVVTGLDVIGIPVVMVCRPGGRCLSVTQGKGSTLPAAKVSGIMEGLEHFCAETFAGPLLHASAADLTRQGRAPIAWPALTRTGRPFDADQPILWAAGRCLRDDRERWVPFELVHLDYRLPLPAGSGVFLASSNGLASGNTVAEATCHALTELIERHETAAFYDLSPTAQDARRLRMETVDDADCRALLARLRAANVAIAAWDLTGRFGVPCFLCDLLDARPDAFRALPRARGIGCHADPAVALARAICEAAQSRLTLIAGSRDDITRAELRAATARWEAAAQQIHGRGTAPFDARRALAFDSFAHERHGLVERIAASAPEPPVWVDLSRADLPVAVVRVIAPGLRAHHAIAARPSARSA